MSETFTAEAIRASFQEVRDMLRELALRMQETDRRMQETDRRMQQTDRMIQETDRKIKEVSQLADRLGNRLGEFVENQVLPGALRMFQDRGIEVTQVFPNATARRDGEVLEVDILAVNGSDLVATECKTRLSFDQVDEHIERLGKIRRMFPQWANHRIFGAVATMVHDEAVARYAEEKGLFVIAPSGDSVRICNAPDFKPRAY